MDEYYRAVRQLPSWLAQPLGQLPTPTAAQIHELRFRTGHGIFLTMSGRQVCLKELSECPQSLRECILDQLQLEEIFHTLCGGAVHAHQNELTQGFLTTPSGCRVGVAGRYVDRDGQMILQTMFLRGECEGRTVDNTTEREVAAWLKLVEEIRPRQVMVYSLDRDTPCKTLQKVPREDLQAIAARVEALGIPCSVA